MLKCARICCANSLKKKGVPANFYVFCISVCMYIYYTYLHRFSVSGGGPFSEEESILEHIEMNLSKPSCKRQGQNLPLYLDLTKILASMVNFLMPILSAS